MSHAFYMDVHIPRAVTDGLRLRGIDVLTSQEDGTTETKDPILLERAAELNRLFVTQDDDFLALAASRQSAATEAESSNYVFYVPL